MKPLRGFITLTRSSRPCLQRLKPLSGFRSWCLGFRVWCLGFRVWCLGFRVKSLGFRALNPKPYRVKCLVFRVFVSTEPTSGPQQPALLEDVKKEVMIGIYRVQVVAEFISPRITLNSQFFWEKIFPQQV